MVWFGQVVYLIASTEVGSQCTACPDAIQSTGRHLQLELAEGGAAQIWGLKFRAVKTGITFSWRVWSLWLYNLFRLTLSRSPHHRLSFTPITVQQIIMGGDKVPPLQVLDKPEDLKTLLKEDRGDDCLSCKIVGELPTEPLTEVKERKTKSHPPGSGAFFGLAGYSYWSGHNQLVQQQAKILASGSRFGMRSRRMGITGISLALAWMGAWRLFK